MSAHPRPLGVLLVVLVGCQEPVRQSAPSAAPSATTPPVASPSVGASAAPATSATVAATVASTTAAPPASTTPPSAPTTPKGPACGTKTSDWCPSPPGDPCGAHKDVQSCRADKKCRGQFYSGESFVACKDDGTGFPSNCPTVGCLSR